MLVFPDFPSGVSSSYFFSRKWSYVPTPCILRLIRVLKNNLAYTKHIWVRFEIPILFEVMLILSQPLPTTLEASPLGFLTTDWMGTRSRNASMFVTMLSVQPLSTSMPAVFHWVRAAQCSSSVEANVVSINTDSCLPPSLCPLHALSRWPFSSRRTCCIVLSPSYCSVAKCPGNPHSKQFLFPGTFLKSCFTASGT